MEPEIDFAGLVFAAVVHDTGPSRVGGIQCQIDTAVLEIIRLPHIVVIFHRQNIALYGHFMSRAGRFGTIHVNIDGAAVGSGRQITLCRAFRGVNRHIAAIGIDDCGIIAAFPGRLVIRIRFERRAPHRDIKTPIDINRAAFSISGNTDSGRRPTRAGIGIGRPRHMPIRPVATVHFFRIDAPIFIRAAIRQRRLFGRIPDIDISVNGNRGIRPFTRSHVIDGNPIRKTAAAVNGRNIHIPIYGQMRIWICPNTTGDGVFATTRFSANVGGSFSVISDCHGRADSVLIDTESGSFVPSIDIDRRIAVIGRIPIDPLRCGIRSGLSSRRATQKCDHRRCQQFSF